MTFRIRLPLLVVTTLTLVAMGCLPFLAAPAPAAAETSATTGETPRPPTFTPPPASAGTDARRPAPAFGGPRASRHNVSSGGWWVRFQAWIVNTQHDLHRQLTKGVRQLKTGNPWTAIWSLALVSFIYGVVHAVGPGHGKAVITSYVFANERTLKRGIWLAIASSLMQAVTAVTAVGVLAVVLNATGFRIQAFAQKLEAASYLLVALVGLWLVVSQIRKLIAMRREERAMPADPHHHEHEHHHHDHAHDGAACGCGHDHIPAAERLDDAEWSWKKALSIIFAVGIRPCTGAIIVLVFAFVNGLFWAGIASTFAMAIGTALTISTLAILAVGSKQLALSLYGGHSRAASFAVNGVSLAAGFLVLFLGVTLFVGALGPARPFG